MPSDESLIPFLKPLGVVVVGASTSSDKLGYKIGRNLLGSGYRGNIQFVSQKAGELFGRPIYADLLQAPDPLDLAILAVPSAAMVDGLHACGQRGIRAAIIVSAGFREIGPEGAALERQCLEVARAYGIRLLGPNCIGVLDTHLPIDTTFLQPPLPNAGGVSFLSHSGAFCAAIIDWSRREGFGFAQIVSLGNHADVTETDLLPLVARDPATRVIALYMEGVSEGRRFVDVASKVTLSKPVVALKVGRFEGARKAAASHTGALAASDTAFDAAFSRSGVLRASSAEQLFDWATALETCPLPKGRAVAILTDAGGPGVIAADALEANSLELARLSASTQAALASALPPAASVHNPVDMLASASPEDYARSLQVLLEDEGVDSALVILPPPPVFSAEAVAAALIPVIGRSEKPVLIALMGSALTEAARQAFQNASIPSYPFPERAASALWALAARYQYLSSAHDDIKVEDPQLTITAPNIANSRPDEIVAACGIAIAPATLAQTAEQAILIARSLGFPVVLKIASPEIVHKSDVGGVKRDVGSPEAVLSGYTQMIEIVRSKQPVARIDGVLVQKQIDGGQEIIMGCTRDDTFGPLMMFGSGGVEAEGLHDVAFALAPLNAAQALELMHRTWAGRRLKGFRDVAPGDEAAVVGALVRLSCLAIAHPEIKEIEINPLRVLAKGAVALDIRMVL